MHDHETQGRGELVFRVPSPVAVHLIEVPMDLDRNRLPQMWFQCLIPAGTSLSPRVPRPAGGPALWTSRFSFAGSVSDPFFSGRCFPSVEHNRNDTRHKTL